MSRCISLCYFLCFGIGIRCSVKAHLRRIDPIAVCIASRICIRFFIGDFAIDYLFAACALEGHSHRRFVVICPGAPNRVAIGVCSRRFNSQHSDIACNIGQRGAFPCVGIMIAIIIVCPAFWDSRHVGSGNRSAMRHGNSLCSIGVDGLFPCYGVLIDLGCRNRVCRDRCVSGHGVGRAGKGFTVDLHGHSVLGVGRIRSCFDGQLGAVGHFVAACKNRVAVLDGQRGVGAGGDGDRIGFRCFRIRRGIGFFAGNCNKLFAPTVEGISGRNRLIIAGCFCRCGRHSAVFDRCGCALIAVGVLIIPSNGIGAKVRCVGRGEGLVVIVAHHRAARCCSRRPDTIRVFKLRSGILGRNSGNGEGIAVFSSDCSNLSCAVVLQEGGSAGFLDEVDLRIFSNSLLDCRRTGADTGFCVGIGEGVRIAALKQV